MKAQGLLIAGLIALTAPFATAQDPTWFTNLEAAQKAAAKDKKIILADFTGSDWCGWCKRLKAEVFDTPEFKTWAAKHVILLEVDFPHGKKLDAATEAQNEKLKDPFRISGFPTIVFMSADGKSLGQTAYVAGGPAARIRFAEAVLKRKP